jgi:hypothetical protein
MYAKQAGLPRSVLTLSDIMPSDEGKYTCVATYKERRIAKIAAKITVSSNVAVSVTMHAFHLICHIQNLRL